MSLEYIELFFHEGEDKVSVFLSYLVEDLHFFGPKSDKIIEVADTSKVPRELASLINENVTMVKDLKFTIGNYNNFDMLMDFTKLLEDIESIVKSINSSNAENVLNYILTYRSILDKIVDLEMQQLPINLRANATDVLLNCFKEYAYPLYIENIEIKLDCIIPGEQHDQTVITRFFQGIPLSLCERHEDSKQIIELLYTT